MNRDQYFQVRKEKREYLGERYFRFNWDAEKVVQVCLNNGSEFRRGKTNTIGVYLIHKMTLMSNYMAMNYVEPVTKAKFDKKFMEAVRMLK